MESTQQRHSETGEAGSGSGKRDLVRRVPVPRTDVDPRNYNRFFPPCIGCNAVAGMIRCTVCKVVRHGTCMLCHCEWIVCGVHRVRLRLTTPFVHECAGSGRVTAAAVTRNCRKSLPMCVCNHKNVMQNNGGATEPV